MRLDARAELDGAATIADLRRALADHAIERGQTPPSDAVLWTASGRRLDDDHLVSVADLTSGGRLWLSPDPPPPTPQPPAIEFAVVGGPDLGPPSVLGPGVHRIGGSSTDDVALLGGGLGAAVVVVEIDPTGVVTLDGGTEPPVRYGPDELAGDGVPVVIEDFTVRMRALEVHDTVDATGGVPFKRTPYRPASARARTIDAMAAPPERERWRSFRADRAAYLRALDAKVEEVRRVAEEERVDRLRALPPLPRLVEEARTRRPSLWARGRDSADLLQLRLGRADAGSRVRVEVERGSSGGGDDGLRRSATDRLAAAAATVQDVPVVLDLESTAAVGLHGDADIVDGVARSLVGQLVARHGPEDVVLAALLAPPALRSFEWMRWLPHVRSSASPLPGDHLAAWPEAVTELLGALLAVAGRENDFPRVVVVVHEDAAVDRAALGRLFDLAPAAGIRVLWVGRDEALLPRQCTTVVRLADGLDSSIISSTEHGEPVAFTAEPATGELLDQLARHLAPLRDASSVARVGSIPRTVGLTEVIGGTPAPADVATTWSVSDGGFLDAPVGVGPEGTLTLDLVDQGPHTLIAGTSGSGKSELLQSWVAALAARHPPERLTFLFIDHEGEAAAAPFVDLVHNVGVVTNLDERMSRRALTSLRAELDRRMALLADRGLRDLTELAAADPVGCPPRLVLVVDEFATLAKEVPDFVAGVVDIAQRGRSLGIHLILATQRPAGAVDENILANTNLRIALRVVDSSDSQSVIGAPDAADIPVPLRGRAFARVGSTELVPFQAAWSGAPRHGGESRRVKVTTLGFGGGGSTTHAAGASPVVGTQLDDVLRAVALAFERSGRQRPRRPWLPPLPDVVSLDDLEVPAAHRSDPGRHAVLGLHDDPANQRQVAATVDLEAEGGLAVFGAGGSGRTTTLRTVAASLTAGAGTDEVQVVAFDFASRALLPLLDLPHTRAVVTADDLSAVAREIEWLDDQLQVRRAILGDERVESLGALRARDGVAVVPRIVVLVDGFASLRAELDEPAGHEWLQMFQRLLVDGRQAGIHPVIAADRHGEVPDPVLGALGARLVLRMADSDDLGAGRGHLRGDEEVQVAILGDDPSGAAQAAALAGRSHLPPTPRPQGLPTEVGRPEGSDHDRAVAVGITEDLDGELEPAIVDLAGGHLLVVGSPGSGRTTAIEAVRTGLRAAGVETVMLDARRARPEDLPAPPAVVLVDDADDLDDATARALEGLADQPDARIVAAVDSAVAARAVNGLVPALKRGRRVLVLGPEGPGEIDQLTGVRVRLRPGTTFPAGRGVLVVDRRAAVVQVGTT